MGERIEVLMRIVVSFVSGIVFSAWRLFIVVICAVNWIYTLFVGKRIQELSELSEIWNTQFYSYLKYLTMVSNERPFPFTNLAKNISKFKR